MSQPAKGVGKRESRHLGKTRQHAKGCIPSAFHGELGTCSRLWLVVYPNIYRVLAPSQTVVVWDFWSINSLASFNFRDVFRSHSECFMAAIGKVHHISGMWLASRNGRLSPTWMTIMHILNVINGKTDAFPPAHTATCSSHAGHAYPITVHQDMEVLQRRVTHCRRYWSAHLLMRVERGMMTRILKEWQKHCLEKPTKQERQWDSATWFDRETVWKDLGIYPPWNWLSTWK